MMQDELVHQISDLFRTAVSIVRVLVQSYVPAVIVPRLLLFTSYQFIFIFFWSLVMLCYFTTTTTSQKEQYYLQCIICLEQQYIMYVLASTRVRVCTLRWDESVCPSNRMTVQARILLQQLYAYYGSQLLVIVSYHPQQLVFILAYYSRQYYPI